MAVHIPQSGNYQDFISNAYDPSQYNQNYGFQQQSYAHNQPFQPVQQDQTHNFLSNEIASDIMMRYGQNLAAQGTQVINEKGYAFFSKIKYYFAVDNAYVARKIGVLIFPFMKTDWNMQYESQGVPVPPRSDLNAPDLYIPFMSFITYVLISGIVLGFNNKFDPEQIGIISSQAVFWLFIENLILCFMIYIMNVQKSLYYLDILAYTSYKFVGMIIILVSYLLLESRIVYYSTLAWTCIAICFFLIRTLKVQVLAQPVKTFTYDQSYYDDGYSGLKPKGHTYLLLFIALVQPLMIYCLTSKTIFGSIIF